MNEQRRSERMVTMTVQVPLLTYRLMQERAERYQVTPTAVAVHQLKVANDPGRRQAAKLELRAQIFDLWRRGVTGPKIAAELGVSLGTVNKHKREIRDNWNQWSEGIMQ